MIRAEVHTTFFDTNRFREFYAKDAQNKLCLHIDVHFEQAFDCLLVIVKGLDKTSKNYYSCQLVRHVFFSTLNGRSMTSSNR